MGFPRQTVFSTLAVFAAVWLTGKFLLPLVSPFLLGTALALAAEPMVRFLNRQGAADEGRSDERDCRQGAGRRTGQ